DGIRYFHVTGVQTCALPIYHRLKSIRQQVPHIDGLITQFVNGIIRKQRKTVRVEFDTEECLAATGDNVVGPRHLPHQLYSRIAEVSMAIVAQYVGIDVKDNFLTAIGKSPVPQRLRLG